ncbi:MAG: SMC-Scp complex subunit ScpB, partial [Actinomycetota bacterium]
MEQQETMTATSMAEPKRAIEAILMVSSDPTPAQLLAQLLEMPVEAVEALCRELAMAYDLAGHGFQLVEVAGGWRYQTHPDWHPYVERFASDGMSTRLSTAALETLAIVAYKQPISRAQVSAIRGVNVDAVLRTLVQRGYVEEVGRDVGPGQAVLFGTTTYFLERVGLNATSDLPALGEFVPSAEVVEALEQTLKVDFDPIDTDTDVDSADPDTVGHAEEPSPSPVEPVPEPAADVVEPVAEVEASSTPVEPVPEPAADVVEPVAEAEDSPPGGKAAEELPLDAVGEPSALAEGPNQEVPTTESADGAVAAEAVESADGAVAEDRVGSADDALADDRVESLKPLSGEAARAAESAAVLAGDEPSAQAGAVEHVDGADEDAMTEVVEAVVPLAALAPSSSAQADRVEEKPFADVAAAEMASTMAEDVTAEDVTAEVPSAEEPRGGSVSEEISAAAPD